MCLDVRKTRYSQHDQRVSFLPVPSVDATVDPMVDWTATSKEDICVFGCQRNEK